MAEETKPTKAEIEAILEKAREASDRAEGMFVQHRAYTQTLIEEGFSLGYKKGQEHLEEYKKEAFENGRIVGFEAGLTDELVEKRVKEAEKERIQVFEGVVIRKKKGGNRASFTVRKISYGVSVERIFPLHSPIIEKIEVVQRGRVRRSRIYYLRGLKGKAARIKERKSTTE